MVKSSSPLSWRLSTLSPCVNSSGSTSIATKLLLWILFEVLGYDRLHPQHFGRLRGPVSRASRAILFACEDYQRDRARGGSAETPRKSAQSPRSGSASCSLLPSHRRACSLAVCSRTRPSPIPRGSPPAPVCAEMDHVDASAKKILPCRAVHRNRTHGRDVVGRNLIS